MKSDIAMMAVAFALLCAGCATDTGFYTETENVPAGRSGSDAVVSFDSGSQRNQRETLERTFPLPEQLDTISPLPRAALVGRWRCSVAVDAKVVTWGGYTLGHLRFCEEYEFRDDGSYSKWRISKNDHNIMPDTEETGSWEYLKDGILRIDRKYGIAFFGQRVASSPIAQIPSTRQDLQRLEAPFDWKLVWHSDSKFTVDYIKVGPGESEVIAGPFGDSSRFGDSGRCDAEGCFRSGNIAIGYIVVSPLRFRKVQ